MENFTNDTIDTSSLPQYETVSLTKLHPNYWKELLVSRSLIFLALGIVVILGLIFIEELTEYKNGYKEQYTIDIQIPYSEYYTQELADIVWGKKQYEFEYWGYERDSWKTLIR